ncbi:MAG: PAS domain S-box protein [Spirochaetia bacterium]|nr:PAS domain S-box protein [Spirochaetia bacterium]
MTMGFVVLWFNKKNPLNIITACMFFCFALWTAGMLLTNDLQMGMDRAKTVFRVTSIGWLLFPAFMLSFAVIFAEKRSVYRSVYFPATLAIISALFVALYEYGLLMGPIRPEMFGWFETWQNNVWVYLFYLYYITACVLSLLLFFESASKSKHVYKKKTSVVLFATLSLCLLTGTINEIVMPRLNVIVDITNIFVLIWALGIFYALVKYRFMSITPKSITDDIIAQMAESLIILDDSFTVVFANRAAFAMSGYTEGELKNMPFANLAHSIGAPTGWMKQLLVEGLIKNSEMELRDKTGKSIPILLTASLITDEGDIKGSICIINDITERKVYEQKLKNDIEKMKELDRLKDDFLSIVSHELRTPITAIRGYLSFFLNGAFGAMSPEQKDVMERVRSNTDRLLTLINNLLDMSKIEAGFLTIEFSNINIVRVVEESMNEILLLAQNNGISLYFKNKPAGEILLEADRERIKQVMLNLLSNAIKFSGPNTEVVVSIVENYVMDRAKAETIYDSTGNAVREGNYVMICVKDEGVGLNEEQKKKIFGRFYQAERADNRKHSGTGIGLYISRKIVEAHGGFFVIESQGLDKGTAFSFYLPKNR